MSILPIEIVLAPSWWHHHEGITFDEDFYFHPAKRVETERKMEQVLYDRWGKFGLGRDHDKNLPVVGPVHLAAGYLLSEMLGCSVDYVADGPPLVHAANRESLDISPEQAFRSSAFKRWDSLCNSMQTTYGSLVGDVNWSGILNLALDLRGQALFYDMLDRPQEVLSFFAAIAEVIEKFTQIMLERTGSTSISVNRTVDRLPKPVHLHSHCSLTMISASSYEQFLMPFDVRWSRQQMNFGIHYCGSDPHRFANVFLLLPRLDFLDVGWGGDVAHLRKALPNTFLNIRYSPVEIAKQSPDQIREKIRQLVHESANPDLTGVCCINMDHKVKEEQVAALLGEVEALRKSLPFHSSGPPSEDVK